MIQRPQTLLLLAIICLMIAALFLPNWHKLARDGSQMAEQTAIQLKISTLNQGQETGADVQNRMHIGALLILVAALAGFSISQFKNRMNQLKLGFGLTLLITLTLVFIMLGAREGEKLVEPQKVGQYGYGFYCLFVALFANMIANRLIRRDERLVRSMDRIR